MTMSRSLLTNKPLEILFATPPEDPAPKRFPVMLQKRGGRWNDFMIGHVVTHLDIKTWCDWRGYKLITLHAGARDARPGEKTDLF